MLRSESDEVWPGKRVLESIFIFLDPAACTSSYDLFSLGFFVCS